MTELAANPDDDVASAVLIGHLARELMNSLPRLFAELPGPERVAYVDRIGRVADAWAAESDGLAGPLPEQALLELRELVEEHVGSLKRRHEAIAFVAAADPAKRPTVPASGIAQWRALHRRTISLAHALLRDPVGTPPTNAEARGIATELTATLHAILAPFYESTAEIDAIVAGAAGGALDVSALGATLKTMRQYEHFFSQASVEWLGPLDSAGYFKNAPGLEDAGGGYVRTPGWPEGVFLARVAADRPEDVKAIALRVPVGDNPVVGRVQVDIARKLPSGLAADFVPRICEWLEVPLSLDLIARDALSLAAELGRGGEKGPAFRLFRCCLQAIHRHQGALDHWLLQEALGDLFDELIEADAPRAAGVVQDQLETELDELGDAARYSSIWMGRVDRPPTYDSERPARLANALYRALLKVPEPLASNY